MKFLFYLFHFLGINFLIREVFQKKRVTILLYHNISKDNARLHFNFLKDNYNLISLSEFITAKKNYTVNQLPNKSLIITLDDGHRGNYELLPLITEMKIPITIFLCSGIVGTYRKFWFKHAPVKYDSSVLRSISNAKRIKYLSETGFNQEKEYENRTTLSKDEILLMKEFVDFQCHTVFHPCLHNCTDAESEFEISESKRQLEDKYGLSVYAFSYPNGDYTDREIDYLKKYGYTAGLTCDLWFNDQNTDIYRLKRLDCRDEASIYELDAKVTGLYHFIKRLLFRKKFGYWKESYLS